MTRRWTPTVRERRRLRALFAAGLSDAEMAADMGWSARQIARLRHEERLLRERPPYTPRPPPAWREVALALFRRHRSDAEIAAEVGRAVCTVANYRRSLGFKLPARRPAPHAAAKARAARRKPIPERDLVVMAAAKRQGHSFESIGRLWRIDARRVRRELGRFMQANPQHAEQRQEPARAA